MINLLLHKLSKLAQLIEIPNHPPFDEEAWLKLIFLLSDTQDWLKEMVSDQP